jgi:predicted RND superfamily exporter protein
MLNKPVSSITKWVIRHAGWVAAVSLLLAAVSAYFTVLLYKNLRTDMEELLPRTARSVMDIDQVTDRLQSTTNLGILVFSKHPEDSKRFMIDLAGAIDQARSPLVSRVEYRIDKELEFFKKRRALFAETPDLIKIRNYLLDRLEYEKEIRNPLNIFSGRELAAPNFDFHSLDRKYSDRVSNFTRFPDGFYASRDQTVRVMLVYLSGKASGISNAQKLRKLIDQVVARMNPRSYAPDLEIKYTGDVENLVEENASLLKDLELSAVLVAALVTLAMWAFYRDAWATASLVASLFVGTLVTFGCAYFVVGYLNANSAFLGSIVIGNGINFGIVVLARYVEERRAGRLMPEAMETASTRTTTATLTAALAAGLSYGSLMLTSFRGFRQFGVIGMMGMVLCWLSAFVTLPAFLALSEWWRIRRHGIRGVKHRFSRHRLAQAVASLIARAPRAILAISALLTAFSVYSAVTYRGQLLESDTSKLRDKTSMTRGSGFLSHYLDDVFGRYISPLVILPPNRAQADLIAARLREEQRKKGPGSLIAGVYTLQDFVPREQRRKIALLQEIRQILKPSVMARLSDQDRQKVRDFLRGEAFRTFGVGDLPKQIKDRFREKDGSLGNLVLVDPVFDEAVLNRVENQIEFVSSIRRVADSAGAGIPVVGQLPLTVDMWQSVRRDGPRATAFAFVSVMILVTVLFRKWRIILLTLSTLLLGVTWLAGAILHFDLKINFLNFIAFPITFGIGVDYGVNIVQRYRIEGPGSILNVVRRTGGAVALASLTTTIGYGSLLIAGNQGFVSFGRVAILGEFTCLAAAILSLPAYLHYRDALKHEPVVSEEKPDLRAAA